MNSDAPVSPPSLSRYNSFNALRLFAAGQVVFMHSVAHLKLESIRASLVFDLLAYFPGVPIFFFISGFLITDSYLRRPSLPRYGSRRILRIYPGLFVNILVLELVVIAFSQHNFWHVDGLDFALYEFVYATTASSNLAQAVIGTSGSAMGGSFLVDYPSGVLWTLTVELCFYLMLPAILLVRHIGKNWLIVSVALIVCGSLWLSWVYGDYINQSGPQRLLSLTAVPYLWMFGIGMLANLVPAPIHWLSKRPYVVLIAFVATAFITSEVSGVTWLFWKYKIDPASIFLVILLGVTTLAIVISNTLYYERIDRTDISYGLYLWHMLVVTLFASAGLTHSAWLFPVVLILSLRMGYLSWIWIEKPVMRSLA